MAEIFQNWDQNTDHVELSIAAHRKSNFNASQHPWNVSSQEYSNIVCDALRCKFQHNSYKARPHDAMI